MSLTRGSEWRRRHPFLYGLSQTFGIFQVRHSTETLEESFSRARDSIEAAITKAERLQRRLERQMDGTTRRRRTLVKTYDEIMQHTLKSRSLGDDFTLREVTRWTVHCAHCGHQIVGDTPQTDKAFEALKRSLADRRCRNPECPAPVGGSGHNNGAQP